jgi:hypothetical protein
MGRYRETLRRKTRVAQVATVLMAAGAGALAVTRPPTASAPIESPPVEPTLPVLPGVTEPLPEPMDLTSALAALNDRVLRIEQPKVAVAAPEPPPIEDDGVKPDDPAPQVAPQATLQYLGYIMSPRKSRAYIGDESGRHFMLAEGQEHEGVTLVSVSSEKIVVRDSGGEREIKLEVRPENQVPGTSAAFGSAVPPSIPGVGQERLPPEFASWPPDEQARYRENMARQQMDARQRAIEEQKRQAKPGASTPIRPPVRPGVPGKQLEKDGEKAPGSLS